MTTTLSKHHERSMVRVYCVCVCVGYTTGSHRNTNYSRVCGLYDRVTQEHKLLASYGPYAGVTLLVQSGHAYAELEAHGGGGV